MGKPADGLGALERLIACADAAIADGGLAALKARDVARCAGCSLGAIYNHVGDLDELVLRVSQRTLARLDVHLDAALEPTRGDPDPLAPFVAWALAYRAFAEAERHRWRALFEVRLGADAVLPDWFVADQLRIFHRLEERLAPMLPACDPAAVRLRARTLFSAVHGIVALGLEQKLVALPPAAIDGELVAFLRAYFAGVGAPRKPEARRLHGGKRDVET